jgi:hypothetical protein
MADALEAAVSSWNSAMASNAQYAVKRGTCDGGPQCVQISEDILSSCGFANATFNAGTSVITGNAQVVLHATWKAWSQTSLKRTLIHELGHLRGLDNYDPSSRTPPDTGPLCAINDAAMQDQFTCGPGETPMDNVTPSDALPAQSSVYNGKTRTYCGF